MSRNVGKCRILSKSLLGGTIYTVLKEFQYFFIQEADAEEVRKKAEFDNKIGIAHSQRDFELKKSGFDMDVNSKV